MMEIQARDRNKIARENAVFGQNLKSEGWIQKYGLFPLAFKACRYSSEMNLVQEICENCRSMAPELRLLQGKVFRRYNHTYSIY